MFGGCGGVFPKDSMIIFPPRWLAGAASERKRGDVHCAAWPPDPQKPFVFLKKTSIFAKSLFCIQRWLGSCLETSCGRLGGTPKRPEGVGPLIWWALGATPTHWVHSSGVHCLDDGGFGGTLAGGSNTPWAHGPANNTIMVKTHHIV